VAFEVGLRRKVYVLSQIGGMAVELAKSLMDRGHRAGCGGGLPPTDVCLCEFVGFKDAALH